MSKGLGKIERWVLMNAYRKTIRRELPDDWEVPTLFIERYGDYYEHPTFADLSRCLATDRSFWEGLYKSEVLLNCFHLRRSKWWPDTFTSYGIHQQSKGYPDSDFAAANVAKVSYTRVKKSLIAKRLIVVEKSLRHPNMEQLTLTKEGTTKAKSLLNKVDF